MQVISEIDLLREQILICRREGQRIAYIPTMGHLHDGHIALVRKAREQADVVIVSIFINPMQFEKPEDYSTYPRTLEEDIAKLQNESVHMLFTPQVEALYPNGIEQHSHVEITGLSNILEGNLRPGHFQGVATIITKFFNIIQPDIACFGEKDYQQLVLIQKMVSDLSFPIEIIQVPTVREMDGLAMSSRNSQLTVDERQRAPVLAKTLRWMSSQIRGGRTDYSELVQDAKDQLRAAGLEPDEIYIRDAIHLSYINEHTPRIVILAAVYLGQIRLIDNLSVDIAVTLTDDSEE